MDSMISVCTRLIQNVTPLYRPVGNICSVVLSHSWASSSARCAAARSGRDTTHGYVEASWKVSVFAIFTMWPSSVLTLASVNCTRCKGAVWAANGRAMWAGDFTHHDSGGDVPF